MFHEFSHDDWDEEDTNRQYYINPRFSGPTAANTE
jgi:hypothetical protein